MNTDTRSRLRDQARLLLDRTAVKLSLTPIGVALDVDFIEDVSLFVGAVLEALEQDGRDTIPPAAVETHAAEIRHHFNNDESALSVARYHLEDE